MLNIPVPLVYQPKAVSVLDPDTPGGYALLYEDGTLVPDDDYSRVAAKGSPILATAYRFRKAYMGEMGLKEHPDNDMSFARTVQGEYPPEAYSHALQDVVAGAVSKANEFKE